MLSERLIWVAAIFTLALAMIISLKYQSYKYESALAAITPLVNQPILRLGWGTLRANPGSPYHLVIGYDAENCEIDTPNELNVIGNVILNMNSSFKGQAGIVIGSASTLTIDGR